MMNKYPRYITPDSQAFDSLELASETEKIVCKNKERKYTAFYATGVYGGIATGYTVGCCLRCYFCWVDWSRDFPERFGNFYSPEEAFGELKQAAHKYKVSRLRLSGAEPTLGKEHLLALLELVENSEFPVFILETNGILFGADKEYVARVSKFTKPHIRVSLKAGTPQDFTRKTGAKEENFELPFHAIRNLLDEKASFHVAAMTDKRIMGKEERESLIQKLWEIDPKIVKNLEKEVVDPYDTTLARLKYADVGLKW
ncbi:MAG: radical SAM protein [Thermoplasmatales archaeon]|nr:radical SAM protein [Thermoplasmatales archaeon]